MRFQVPQFIESETKIVGPFTLMQFLWVAGGAAFLFLLFSLVQGVLLFIFALPIALIFGSMAFVKINGVPLLNYASYSLTYLINPKKYTYKNEPDSDQSPLLDVQSQPKQ